MNRRLICILLMLSGFSAAFGLESGDNRVQGADREDYPFKNTTLVAVQELKPTEFIIVDGQPVRLEHGLDLRNKDLSGTRIINRTLADVDFSGSSLLNADLSQTRFVNCSFRNVDFEGATALDASFEGCDFTDAWFENNASFWITREQFLSSKNFKEDRALSYFQPYNYPYRYTTNIDYSGFRFDHVSGLDAAGGTFTNARLIRCAFYNMTKEQLCSTWNYKNSKLDFLSLSKTEEGISLSGLDLSNFRIRYLALENYDVSDVNFNDAVIWEMLLFFCCSGVTKEQLQSTWNWKNRRFDFCLISTELDWSNTDFSGFTFCCESRLCGNVTGADFTDAKFLVEGKTLALRECQGLTLEQVKSTWNYKTGNIEGVLLPEEVQRQLDAETTAAPD